MMSRSFSQLSSVVLLSSLLGCVGNNASLNTALEALEGVSSSPVVEAHIQYLGPDARWAGPALWTLHVSAREAGAPVIELSPEIQPKTEIPQSLTVGGRAPASALGLTRVSGSAVNQQKLAEAYPSVEQIRDRLAHLARVIQAGDASVEACSSAVKVRLSRADGSVVEKQGCRGSTNWSQVVSEFTAEWIKVSGMHVVQSREPASTPGSGATHSGHETQAEAHDVPPNG